MARKAQELQPGLKVVVLALGDAIPVEYDNAPSWLEAVVAEADIIEDRKPFEAAVLAVMGHHFYRSPSLRSDELPYLSCPRLTPREYEVLDRQALECLIVKLRKISSSPKRLHAPTPSSCCAPLK